MCTVTYIPKGNDSFILTHNRDENIKRAIASPPLLKKINGINHIFPVDPNSGGTWIGLSENNRIACLLNGGQTKHTPQPPYRHSRGRIILDYFGYSDFDSFLKNYNFNQLEPFTFLIFENETIYELILNEKYIKVRNIDKNKPFIYSSSTLYSHDIKSKRQIEFYKWYEQNPDKKLEDILIFHSINKYENYDNRIDGKNILKTVSTTSIFKKGENSSMNYFDHINNFHLQKSIEINSAIPA